MPLTKMGSKVASSMRKQYGKTNWEKVFYSTMNKNNMKGKWEGPKPRGHSPMGVNSMPMGGEPNSSKFCR